MKAAFWILLALFLAGCATWPETPQIFLAVNSKAEAMKIATDWEDAYKGRDWGIVGYTGSMRPALNGGEIVLLQRYNGQPLNVGQFVVYYRTNNLGRIMLKIIHQITAVNDRAVYISGINNHYSDGWFPKDEIRFLVVRVVTFPA